MSSTTAGLYRSRPALITAVQFDGANIGEIMALTRPAGGVTLSANADGTLTLRENGRMDRIITPLRGNCWVAREEDGAITTLSERAFAHRFEPAGSGDTVTP